MKGKLIIPLCPFRIGLRSSTSKKVKKEKSTNNTRLEINPEVSPLVRRKEREEKMEGIDPLIGI